VIKKSIRVSGANAIYTLLTLSAVQGGAALCIENDIQYTKLNESSFLIEYRPASVRILSDTLRTGAGLPIRIRHCGTVYETDKPQLPYRSLYAAVPEHGRLSAVLQGLEFRNLDERTLQPAGPTEAKVGPETWSPPDAEATEQNGYFPASVCHIENLIRLGRMQVAPITLYPVQYHAQKQQWRIIEKMVIRFDITPSERSWSKSAPGSLAPEPAWTSLWNKHIVNYQQARTWILPSLRKQQDATAELTGLWHSFAVSQEGIYRIEYAHLQKLGYDSTSLNMAQTGVYTAGGRELDVDLAAAEPSLRQVASYFHDDNRDGLFGRSDYLLFYGQSVSGWESLESNLPPSHYINRYTREHIYWLNSGHQQRVAMVVQSSQFPDALNPTPVSTGIGRIFMEEEILNNAKSGYRWYWDWFNGNSAGHYALAAPNLVALDSARLKLHFQGASEHPHTLSIFLNKQLLGRTDIYYTLAKTFNWQGVLPWLPENNQLQIVQLSASGQKDEVYFDWLELEYRQSLTLQSGVLAFWSEPHAGACCYQISQAPTGALVFDITDPYAVRWLQAEVADSFAAFTDFTPAGMGEKHYLAMAAEQIKPVGDIDPAPHIFPRLRSTTLEADYLIVSSASLSGPTLERLAQHRRDSRFWPHAGQQPRVMNVLIEEIYDEFSAGMVDPAALRNFLRYAYRQWETAPAYVLLVGDACFDINNNGGASPPTLIPTYQDQGIATDDWFVCLESEHIPAMFIGRLPVQNQDELATAVQKIISYDTALQPGPWQNNLLFVADDDFSPSHTFTDYVFSFDSESMAADSIAHPFDVHKIYLSEYKRDAFGVKPDARRDLFEKFNRGCLYVNFLGHGNLEVLTHEGLFNSPDDIGSLKNQERLPLFFAGTCAAGQFDYDRKKSLAEELLLHRDGGCLAVIAATRWNAHNITSAINQDFFHTVFSTGPDEALSIGQALAGAKLRSRYPDHRELLVLFGDPAQRLALPSLSVDCRTAPDTLTLRKNVLLKGRVSRAGEPVDDFSGSVQVKIYENVFQRYATAHTYTLTGRLLYEDTAPVVNGWIDHRFRMQSDSTSGGLNGRMVLFAWENGERPRTASGYLQPLFVAPDTLAPGFHKDTTGPEIRLLVKGVEANTAETIQIEPAVQMTFSLKDAESGVQYKAATDFRMTLQLDHSADSLWDVTSQFIPDAANAQSGTVSLSFDQLTVGPHNLVFSAWDNALNLSSAEYRLQVVPAEFALQDPLNYPNPAARTTFFTFAVTHDAQVTIKVYTVAGRLVRNFTEEASAGFNRVPQEGWDCRDQDGDELANGVYLYKITARERQSEFYPSSGRTSEALGRLVIMR